MNYHSRGKKYSGFQSHNTSSYNTTGSSRGKPPQGGKQGAHQVSAPRRPEPQGDTPPLHSGTGGGAQALAQRDLESAFDEAMRSNRPREHKIASEVLDKQGNNVGILSNGLLKMACDYAQMQYHARGLNPWLCAYLDKHHEHHLKSACDSGDLATVLCVLKVYRSGCAKGYTKGLSAERLKEVLMFGDNQASAARMSRDPQAHLVLEQANRVLGAVNELFKLAAPESEPKAASGSREPPEQAPEGDLQLALKDLNRLMLFFDGNEVRLPPADLKQLHGLADKLRQVFRGRTGHRAQFAFDMAGHFRARASAALIEQRRLAGEDPFAPAAAQPVTDEDQGGVTEGQGEVPEVVAEAPQERCGDPVIERGSAPVEEPPMERDAVPVEKLTMERVTPAQTAPSNAVPRQPLPQLHSVYFSSADDLMGFVGRQASMVKPVEEPKAHTLTNHYFELTVSQVAFADNLAQDWGSELAKENSNEVAPSSYLAGSDPQAKRYEELLQATAYAWTVQAGLYADVAEYLSEHPSDQKSLNNARRALCLVWSEDQVSRVRQMLQFAINKTQAPGLELALNLLNDSRLMVMDRGEHLYRLCQKGNPQDIVACVRADPWLPLLLMKRAWTSPQFGELIDTLHALATQWQSTPGDEALQGLGKSLQRRLPPPPMAWVSAEDFVERLLKAVELRHLAEVDFALATHQDKLMQELDGLPTPLKQQLLDAFDKMLAPMEVRFDCTSLQGGTYDKLMFPWLKRAGFEAMEGRVSMWQPMLKKSLETSRQ